MKMRTLTLPKLKKFKVSSEAGFAGNLFTKYAGKISQHAIVVDDAGNKLWRII